MMQLRALCINNNNDGDYMNINSGSNTLVGLSDYLEKILNFKEAFIPGKNYEVISKDPETGRTLDVCEVIGEDGERYQFNEKYFKFVFKVMDDELPSMVKFRLNKEISNKEIEEFLLSDPIKVNDLYSNENDNEYKAYEIPKDVEDSSGNLHSRFMEEVEKILAEYNEQKKKNTDVKNDDEMHDHFKNTLKNYKKDEDNVSKLNDINYEDTPVSRLNPKKISPYQMVKINEEFVEYYGVEKTNVGIVECVCLNQCRVLFDSGFSTWVNIDHIEIYINGKMSTTNIDSQRSVYNSFKLNHYNRYINYMNTSIDEFEDDELRDELQYCQDIFDIVLELDSNEEIQENDAYLIDELMVTMIMRLDYLYRKNVCSDNDLSADLDILGSVEKSKFYDMICKYTLTSEPQKLISYITSVLNGKMQHSTIIIIICICMDIYMDVNDIRQFQILKNQCD